MSDTDLNGAGEYQGELIEVKVRISRKVTKDSKGVAKKFEGFLC